MYNRRIITSLDEKKRSLAEIVFRHMDEGIIVLDQDFKIVLLNQRAETVTLYKEKELIGLHYSHLFKYNEQFHVIVNFLHENRSWKGELQKLRKDGEVYPEFINIRVVLNSKQSIINYVVVFRDITDEKKSQKELRLAAKVLENTSEGVLVTDQKGYILSVNPAFQVVTGYSEEEVIGLQPNVLQSGIHGPEFYKKLWGDLSINGNWKGEIWNKRKNGEIYPEWLTISAIKDDGGTVTNYVAVFSDISDRKQAEEQLRKLAHYDSLTGVANRYSLNKRLSNLIETAEKYNQQLAVMFLDLDRFKYVNDTLGHSYGDLLLKAVSSRLKGLIKNKDIIARLGGDEFVIVLSNIKHPKEAVLTAETIIEALKRPFILKDQEVYISTSIGVSLYPLDGTDTEVLLRNADKAMYEAKNRGRNQFELYYDDLDQNKPKHFKLENYLRKALENGEFFLVYHPQIELSTGKMTGVEALIRWNNPYLGFVSPGEFIPLAEETGLIIPISEWVIEKACNEIKKLHVNGYPNLKVSINISAIHFNQDHFLKSIKEIIHHTNINPHLVELELTESTIMPNATEAIEKLVKLKQLGFKLSVDDFGTGYSSLSYLNRFPIDTLKIDQSFIKKLSVYKDDASIVRAIITMAHRLHMTVVAEGVEQKKQYSFLEQEGCDMVQGFYITKPIPFQELLEFIEFWEMDLLN